MRTKPKIEEIIISSQTLSDDDWAVVDNRLLTMPCELHLGISGRSFTKTELMAEVKKRSPVGLSYAQMQLGFISWLLHKGKII